MEQSLHVKNLKDESICLPIKVFIKLNNMLPCICEQHLIEDLVIFPDGSVVNKSFLNIISKENYVDYRTQ